MTSPPSEVAGKRVEAVARWRERQMWGRENHKPLQPTLFRRTSLTARTGG